MGVPYLGEIRLMSFNYPPKGWAACNGQFLPINQNQALFALLGTMYGGNGQTTFALPDLRDRIPVSLGGSMQSLGQRGGEAAHTLTVSELPAHSHFVNGSAATTGGTTSPANAFLGGTGNGYRAAGSLTALQPATVTNTGGSQPHTNQQPYLALQFCIALTGIFPSQN